MINNKVFLMIKDKFTKFIAILNIYAISKYMKQMIELEIKTEQFFHFIRGF